jgi:DNA transformation protein
MLDKEFVNYIQDILEPFGDIKIKAMFGGHGVYKDNLIFAIIVDNELYFKANKTTIEFFKDNQSEPFIYESKGKSIAMSYWKVPDNILEDKEPLTNWVEIAFKAALDSKKSKNVSLDKKNMTPLRISSIT